MRSLQQLPMAKGVLLRSMSHAHVFRPPPDLVKRWRRVSSIIRFLISRRIMAALYLSLFRRVARKTKLGEVHGINENIT